MKNSFFLTTPAQKKNTEASRLFEGDALKQWLDGIPTANYGLTSRLLHDHVRQFNELEGDPGFRLQAMETMRPGFLMIEEYFRARLSMTGFPLADNERKIGALLVEISRDFATGYWLVLREWARRDPGWLQGKLFALAIQRVLRGLSGVLMAHYLMALPVPAWVWMDIHSLYRLALKKKRQATKVKDAACRHLRYTSVEDTYKQILLLTLAEPNGLMQREILELYLFTEKLTDHVPIEHDASLQDGVHCLLYLDEDKPPVWSAHWGDDDGDATIHRLKMAKLVDYFKHHRSRLVNPDVARYGSIAVSNEGKIHLAPELADYLERRWSGVALAGDAEFNDRLDRMFSIGLKATHSHLSPVVAEDSVVAGEWLVEASSERALSCRFDQAGQLFIGSLVSFRCDGGNQTQRALGTVCRINMVKPDGPVHFQVQVLSPLVLAVGIQPLKAKDAHVYQRTLLYTEQTQNGFRTFIIVESQRLKAGDCIRLLSQSGSIPILLDNRTNVGLGYWRFECVRIPEEQSGDDEMAKKGYDFV